MFSWHISLILQPRASFKFPYGEISLEQKEEEEEDVKRVFSINGILKGHILNGICTARYKDEDLNLRYCFKVISFDIPFEVLLVSGKWWDLIACI